jgi:hypothetical protein
MFADLHVSSLRGELDRMSADGGVRLVFSVFVPFEGEEFEEFFSLCDRFETAARELNRAEALRPCPQILSWEERGRDSRALELIQDTARLKLDHVAHAIRAFRARVRDRYVRQREGKKDNRL